MSRPEKLTTQIFLDSGDPHDTGKALSMLGFLDGQTTNPTLMARHPAIMTCLGKGQKCSEEMVYGLYREAVQGIAAVIPGGSISIEAYADANTSVGAITAQAREMYSWTPNARIKLPVTQAGLEAAEELVKEGMRLNMTLCFSQEQAAAVHAATVGAEPGQVVVSPFVGRLEGLGWRGMDLVGNIGRMYREGNSHVRVLAASVRNLQHLFAAISAADFVTVPLEVLEQWAKRGLDLPPEHVYAPAELQPVEYRKFDLLDRWDSFDLRHELTEQGLQRFADDWNALIAK
jgi:transaldolase